MMKITSLLNRKFCDRNRKQQLRQQLRTRPLGCEPLENRLLLSADFNLSGGALMLDNFTQVSDESLSVSEDGNNYRFALSEGTWTGMLQAGLSLDSGGQVLEIEKSLLNAGTIDEIAISDTMGIDFSVTFDDVNMQTLLGTFALIDVGDVAQATGSFVKFSRLDVTAASVTLAESGNDFGSVRATAMAGGVTLFDIDDIVLGTPGLADTAGVIGGNYVVTAEGTITVSAGHGIDSVGTSAVSLSARRNIALLSGSSITTVDGDMSLVTNQGATATSGDFIGIDIVNATLASTSGSITLSGRGGNTFGSQSQYGVAVRAGARVGEGTTGLVTVEGTGGMSGSNFNYGVYVVDSGSRITSGGGNVSVSGIGGGTASSHQNVGVRLEDSGIITAGGIGNVTVMGTGGNTSGTGSFNRGVLSAGIGAEITSGGGNVTVTGVGGGAGSSTGNDGVSGNITAGGNGTVTIIGSGGNTSGTGGHNRGIWIQGSATKITSSGGDLLLQGAGGGGELSFGIQVSVGAQILATTGTPTVTLTADSMDFISNSSIDAGNNIVVLRPVTDATSIDLGGEDVLGGSPLTLGLTATELNRITAGSLVIGRDDIATGTIVVSTAVAPTNASALSLITARNIVVNANLTGGGGGLTLSANRQATPTVQSFNGVTVQGGAIVTATGLGNVQVSGTGGSTGLNTNRGVYVSDTGSMITSGGGDVIVTGQGSAASNNGNFGVYIVNSGRVTSGGTGSVTVDGTGGAGPGNLNMGVYLAGGLSTQVRSGGSGAVSVSGTGGTGAGSDNYGVYVNGGTVQITSGGGAVNVTGIGTSNSEAILLANSASINSGGNAPLTITADSLNITGATPGTINSGTGTTTIRTRTTGTRIDLGGNDVLGGSPLTLGLTDAELDRITAGVLKIGSNLSGLMTISQVITPAGTSTLHLVSGAGVSQSAAIVVANLAVQAAGTVSLSNGSNNAGTVAIRTTAGHLSYSDSDGFAIGQVNGVSGVSSIAGSPSLTAFTGDILVTNTSATNDLEGGPGFSINVTLFGNDAMFSVANGAVVSGSGAQITADRVDLAGTLTTTATVTLQPISAGRLINLGSTTDAAVNTLELSDAELDRITAGVLRIGNSNAGAINISQAINPAMTSTIHLVSGGQVTQTAPIVTTNLAVEGVGNVSLQQINNDFVNLAIHTTGGSVSFYERNGVTITTVDGLSGIAAPGNTLNLLTNGDLVVSDTAAARDLESANALLSVGGTLRVLDGALMWFSSGGAVFADRVDLIGNVSANSFQLRRRAPGGRIDLGSMTDVALNTLELSDAELNRITANMLRIGMQSSELIITAPINPDHISTLRLHSNGLVHQIAPIQVSKLAVEANAGITLNDPDNDVDFLGLYSSMGGLDFTNRDDFVVGNVDGIPFVVSESASVKLRSLTGDITVTSTGVTAEIQAAGAITVVSDGPSGTFTLASGAVIQSTGGTHTYTADKMVLSGAINAGSQTVILRPSQDTQAINLGSTTDAAVNTLELSDAELDRITAGTLQIGDSNSGAITVSAAITHANNLSLTTGSQVTISQPITMAANKNLTASAVGTIELATNTADLSAIGTGVVSMTALRNIALASGSSITTVDGDLILTANSAGTTTGDFVGIELNDADISSTNGDISLTGQGGDTGERQYGVHLVSGATVASIGTGPTAGSITVNGTGGDGTLRNTGVRMDTGAAVRTFDGDIQIVGTGGGDGSAGINIGVYLLNGAVIESTGVGVDAGSITIHGVGGIGTFANRGVELGNTNTRLTAHSGNIQITGQGGAGTDSNLGVYLRNGAVIESTGADSSAATINVSGTGGAGVNSNIGIQADDAGTQIRSAFGDITLIGQGAGSGSSNEGVFLSTGPVIRSTGAGAEAATITIAGAGASGSGGRGVVLSGAATQLTTQDGAILITGEGSRAADDGVRLSGLISSTGTAPVTIDGNGKLQVTSTGQITTAGGAIILQADRMDLAGSVQATLGSVQLNTASVGWGINLGSTSDAAANTLELSDAELDRITAGVLKIGSNLSGMITISQAITPAGTSTLHLISGAGVSQSAAIVVPNLAVQAAGTVSLSNSSNNANTVAIRTTSGHLAYEDSNGFTIGQINGVSGVSSSAGSPSLTAVTGDILVSNTPATNDLEGGPGFNINVTLFGSEALFTVANGAVVSGSGAQITANRMDLAGTVATTSTVTLQPSSAGRLINLGSTTDAAVNTLELSDAELDRITAGALIIGGSNAGAITISQPISPAGTSTLRLTTGAGVSQTAAPLAAATPISVANLAIQASGTIDLQAASNDVDQLAAQTSSGNVEFADSDGFAVGTVAGQNGIVASAGSVSLTAMSGDVVISNTSAANDLEVTADFAMYVSLQGANAMLTLAGGAVVHSTGGVNLSANRMDLAGTISAGSNRTVTLSPRTNGWLIDLGSTADAAANTLELSDAELDRITGTSALLIGSSTAGAIHVSQLVSPSTMNPLVLTTAGAVTQAAEIVVGGLAVTAGGTITLTHSNNDVFAFAAKATSGDIAYVDRNGVNVGFVYTVQGIDADNGEVALTSLTGNLRVNNTPAVNDIEATGAVSLSALGDESTLTISSGAKVQAGAGTSIYTADNMDFQGTVAADVLSLLPAQAGKQISLGSAIDTTANTLELSDAELDRITAGVLKIGSNLSGMITISQAITPAGTSTLHLVSGNAIVSGQATDTDLTISNLVMIAATGIGTGIDPLETMISTLEASGGSGGVFVANTGALTLVGSGVTADGDIVVTVGSPLMVQANVLSRLGSVRLSAEESASPGDDLTVASGISITSQTGNVVLEAGDAITLAAASIVTSPAGTIVAQIGLNDLDNIGVGSISGTLISPNPVTVQGGNADDSITVYATASVDDIEIKGGNGNDLIVVQVSSGEGVRIDGEAGSDSFVIQLGDLAGPVTVTDTTGTNQVQVLGTPEDDNLTVTSTQVIAGSETINLEVVGADSTTLVIDGGGGTNQVTVESTPAGTTVTGMNVAASLSPISAPLHPNPVNTQIEASGFFIDLDVGDEHTATWDWGDGSTSDGNVTETSSSTGTTGTVTGIHNYTNAGVYTVKLTVTDNQGNSTQALFQYIVVYDPSAGFVTGGGWINSPPGAYVANHTLTGKATFGFNSKYQNGNNVPTGNTEFQFKVADFNFKSASYEWLVVSGAKARFRGIGTVNGTGSYGFELTAWDGQVNGGGGTDRFRIKIWNKNQGNGVVYDNMLGADDGADPTTTLGGGSIVIHKSAQPLLASGGVAIVSGGGTLTQEALNQAVDQAIGYWRNSGIDAEAVGNLQKIHVEVAELGDGVLGIASDTDYVWIDRDAAGYGWQLNILGMTNHSVTVGMDLLSVVAHELGHKLGLEHSHDDNDLMGFELQTGTHRLPIDSSHQTLWTPAVDQSFADLAPTIASPGIQVPFGWTGELRGQNGEASELRQSSAPTLETSAIDSRPTSSQTTLPVVSPQRAEARVAKRSTREPASANWNFEEQLLDLLAMEQSRVRG